MIHDPDHPASRMQRAAAAPETSTWLAANAGSGKTRVLIDRVARLLLSGVQPQRILCLTYTKAAASEMQNRLFQRLGAWAMLEEQALQRQLSDLGLPSAPTGDGLRLARQLFARAIETPGGLKIQTIHSFCASILRRFPLEAGVPPHFVEIDDRSAALLRDEVISDMADGPHVGLVDGLARLVTDEALNNLANELIRNRAHFQPPQTRDELLAVFGLPAGFADHQVVSLAFDGSEPALFATAIPILEQQSKTMIALAGVLRNIDPQAPSMADLQALFQEFLYSKSNDGPEAKIKSIPTANAGKAMGAVLEDFHAFMQRVADARNAQMAVQIADRSAALHAFAARFLQDYEARKAARGWLDFDDLILKASALLTEKAQAQWVLYRLDGGIDHILVDEAQDTSPAQWQVIQSLAAEFHAGEGARSVPRTLFVVGDKKQSIYSFQGADLNAFDQTRALFAQRLESVGEPLANLSLDHSFRSSSAILDLVDATLAGAQGLGGAVRHLAFRQDMPGRVDLWPFQPKTDEPEKREWYDPVDIPTGQSADITLARQIARHLRGLIADGVQVITREGPQPLHEGHVLILLQRRKTLFAEIIRACKAEGLAIAGADRLDLVQELAVRDVLALLQFLEIQEDDLSLAAALRSPLLGWSEDRLYRLAQPRGGAYLWEALRGGREGAADTLAILNDLRDQADFLRPYELIERILTRHDGRRRLLARLGPEAEDGIDELLQQALAYERTEVPSLAGFLAWLGAGDVVVKRQPGGDTRVIRVMTVHGAKGLEAPLVILPDTAMRKLEDRDAVLRAEDGPALWKPAAPATPREIAAVKQARVDAQAEERMRLLYVAMTRAESWLIVAGAGDPGKPGEGKSWYDLIAAGFSATGQVQAMPLVTPLGLGQRLQFGDWPPPAPSAEQAKTDPVSLPDWATRPAPVAAGRPAILAPSALPGAKALAGEAAVLTEQAAMARGSALHLLLEHLPLWPEADWGGIALDLLAGQDAGDAAALLTEAAMVLRAPDLRWLFTPDALTEVGISARLADLGGRVINGAIDRLLIWPDRILAVDYKSNASVPASPNEVPDGLLRQMGAYAAALALVYPDRRVEVAILWTRTAQFMPLPPDLVMAALRSTIA